MIETYLHVRTLCRKSSGVTVDIIIVIPHMRKRPNRNYESGRNGHSDPPHHVLSRTEGCNYTER